MNEKCGFSDIVRLDASSEILKILDEVESKLAAYLAFQRMSGTPAQGGRLARQLDGKLERSPELVAKIRSMVIAEELGYWLYVGEKLA